jgi:hypothetical protein
MLTSGFSEEILAKVFSLFKNGHFKNVQNRFSFLLFGSKLPTFFFL